MLKRELALLCMSRQFAGRISRTSRLHIFHFPRFLRRFYRTGCRIVDVEKTRFSHGMLESFVFIRNHITPSMETAIHREWPTRIIAISRFLARKYSAGIKNLKFPRYSVLSNTNCFRNLGNLTETLTILYNTSSVSTCLEIWTIQKRYSWILHYLLT